MAVASVLTTSVDQEFGVTWPGGAGSASLWRLRHLKALLGLEDPLPRWLPSWLLAAGLNSFPWASSPGLPQCLTRGQGSSQRGWVPEPRAEVTRHTLRCPALSHDLLSLWEGTAWGHGLQEEP